MRTATNAFVSACIAAVLVAAPSGVGARPASHPTSAVESAIGPRAVGTVRSALPTTTDAFAFGMANAPGSVAQLTSDGISWNYRYQYLAGGVNTGNGWTTWNANADFPAFYMKESADSGLTPVFTYYQLLQSKPARGSGEDEQDFNNLNDPDTMRAYYTDFRTLLDKARAFDRTVIIHIEPDLSGYMQQRVVSSTNSAASVPAAVSRTGLSDLKDLPDTYKGFNLALLRLRDRYAPKVLLATHASAWSTRVDISTSTDPGVDVAAAGVKAAAFLETAGVGPNSDGTSTYDLIFVDASDRDAGFHQVINGDGGAHWWDETNTRLPNFNTFNRYLQALTSASGRRAFLWQVPIGNTVMRTENNTWNHFQDNRVQYWLGGYPSDGHLAALARSGVAAILWGRGADGNTSAEDAARDGVTNPAPVNGNNRVATSPDDDGGYLKERMRAYQSAGTLRIDNVPGKVASATPPATVAAAAQSPSVGRAAPSTTVATGPDPTGATSAVGITVGRAGSHRISFNASTTDNSAVVRVAVDGVIVATSLRVPKRTAKKPFATLSTRRVFMTKGPHTVTFVSRSGRVTIASVKVT